MFWDGQAPTGSKDPFALRRAANAIVKILAESGLPLRLSQLLMAVQYPREHAGKPIHQRDQQENVSIFLRERLHFYLKDVRGFAYDVVNAVLASDSDDVRDAIARAEALTAVRGSDDFIAISTAFKRIKNILRQAGEKGFVIGSAAEITLSDEVHRLRAAAAALAPEVAKLREQRAYSDALAQIATLRPVVDSFFDKVMVLDPDEKVRGANLALISSVLSEFSGIADFSEIVTA
jgi:glycyl-tRNA synthetase beta chain